MLLVVFGEGDDDDGGRGRGGGSCDDVAFLVLQRCFFLLAGWLLVRMLIGDIL